MAPTEDLPQLRRIREVAAQRAVDPITLEDLRMRPDQVGALIFDGHRVEPALYHRDSVVGEDGQLIVPNSLSPVSLERVNGFMLVPPISDLYHFIDFLDWNLEGVFTVHDVATALASVLPADVEGIEHFIRDHLDLNHDGVISKKELREQILPYCGERLTEFLAATLVPEEPTLRRGASKEELSAWFDHWDLHGQGRISNAEVAFAVSKTIYQALGPDLTNGMKQTVTRLFLAEAQLDGKGFVTRRDFVEAFAPALLANLPESNEEVLAPAAIARQSHRRLTKRSQIFKEEDLLAANAANGFEQNECDDVVVDVGGFDRQLSIETMRKLGKNTANELEKLRFQCHDPVEARAFSVQAKPSATLGELRSAVAAALANLAGEASPQAVLLYVGARMLDGQEVGENVPLAKLPVLRQGAVLIVVRDNRPSVMSSCCIL